MDNARFNQLLDLARAGDEASVAQLWHEFGFDFHAEVPPSSDTRHSTPDTCSLEGGM
jgi:hypothetical protein